MPAIPYRDYSPTPAHRELRPTASIFGGRATVPENDAPRAGIAPPTPPIPPRHGSGGGSSGNEEEVERFRNGPQELPSAEVNAEMVRLFAQVSGDHNPYHLDAEYARQSRYQEPIGHGILTVVLALSELSRALPSYVPQEIEIERFIAPVLFGDRVRAIVLGAERERTRWRLPFVVANQDDVDVLQGSLQLRPRTPEDGPPSWLQALSRPLEELCHEALEWSRGVQPFPVRPVPQLQVGQVAHYASTVSEERLKANVVLSRDSPWLTQVFALEAIAQASATLAPGFILVGLETGNCPRPFPLGQPLQTRATITRQGTLVHRPLDRIRIDMEVLDASEDLRCTGAVYKESEAPVGTTPQLTSDPYPGVEFVVPATPRLLGAFARLHPPPFLTILDMEEGVAPGDRAAAREAVVHHLQEMSQEQRDLLRTRYLFLRPNNLRTPWAARDLLEVVGQVGDLLDGILLSHVQGPEDLRVADRILSGLEEAHGWERGRLKIEAMIHQPEVARRAQEIAVASPRLVGLVNAIAGNLATPELGMALGRAALGGGVDVIDGLTRISDDGRQTALDTLRTAMMGFQRKWAFTPIQLNAVLNPKLYLSDRDMQQAGIPEVGVRWALAHQPGRSVLWGEARISHTPRPSHEEPLPLSHLEEHAAREEPLL